MARILTKPDMAAALQASDLAAHASLISPTASEMVTLVQDAVADLDPPLRLSAEQEASLKRSLAVRLISALRAANARSNEPQSSLASPRSLGVGDEP